jgi:hypothetical protein
MISLLLILLSFGGLAPREQPGNDDLRLTVRISDIKSYCANEPDVHFLQLRLELTFANTGSRILIIQKRCLAEITYWRTAETVQELKTAFWGHILIVTSDSGDVTDTGRTPDEDFAVLKPGRSYMVRTDFSLSSLKPLPGKETFMQISASTWSGTKQQAEKLQKKWEKIGVLWFKNVRSEPISFTLDKATKVKKCP